MNLRNKSRLAMGLMVLATVVTTSGRGTMSVAANPLSVPHCDFNGDGFDDLAIGVPGEDIDGLPDAGAVQVLYGRDDPGLHHEANQLWWQGADSIAGAAEADDAFGSSLACGDFDFDEVDDLAIGVPREDIDDAAVDAGAVNVIYGESGIGLTPEGNEVFSQSGSVLNVPERGDLFGAALAVGDFDDDGVDDVAVGVPGEDLGRATAGGLRRNAGAVNVLYGTGSGLGTSDNQFWTQNTNSVEGSSDTGDRFGQSLAAGDFDPVVGGNSPDDLAVGAPGEGVAVGEVNQTNAGAVNVLFGDNVSGLTATGNKVWSQRGAVRGAPELDDQFGFSLAVGDFDNDSDADLAVGVPGEDLDSGNAAIASAGGVNVLYSNGSGLSAAGDQFWSQQSDGVKGVEEPRDYFGYSLISGDFAYTQSDDLAVGVLGEDVGSGNDAVRNAGLVHILFGSAAFGIDFGDDILITQDDLDGDPEEGNTFGATLAAGNFDGDDDSELAVAVPGQTVVTTPSAGVVVVRDPDQNQTWIQGLLIGGVAQPYDRFGGQPTSSGVYRIPYADGTQVRANNDHLSHTPLTRVDLGAVGEENPVIVAAADGSIRAIVDSNAGGNEADNNYVWMEHPNGEWTKYSHMVTDSVTDLGHQVGDFVTAGTALGIEGTVGAPGEHLHFEVGVPDSLSDPFTVVGGWINGQNRIPLICGIPGNIFIHGRTYTAAPC